MSISYIVNHIYNSMTYILPTGNHKDCWLVDCGDIDGIVEQGWVVKGVLITHSHYDHIYGLNNLVSVFPDVMVYTNKEGMDGLLNPKWNFSRYHEEIDDIIFSKPENICVLTNEGLISLPNGPRVEVFFTPGHEPSCLCYRIENLLFTGDSYIPGIKVVATFPRSNRQMAKASLTRIKEMENAGAIICPGHFL